MPLCGKRIGAVEEPIPAVTKGIWRVQLSHAVPARSARFDDPNLVSFAGLVPAWRWPIVPGLARLADRHLTVPGGAGVAAGAKVGSLVAGMVAGADSIADMDLLRHGGMGRLFTRGAGALDAGHVPAGVPVRARAASSTRSLPGSSPAWPGTRRSSAAGGAGHLPRYRRHGPGDVRLCQAGRRLRLLRRQGTQRAAGHDVEARRRRR